MQKFFRGDLVRLADEFPISMAYFEGAGSLAVVDEVTETGQNRYEYMLYVILKKGDVESFCFSRSINESGMIIRTLTGEVNRVKKPRIELTGWYNESLLTFVSEDGARALPKSHPFRKEYDAKEARRLARTDTRRHIPALDAIAAEFEVADQA